jgi:hypothetical protein
VTPSTTTTAFYCVADERYFLGAVGMLNSLRLAGHREPVFLLDCGLTPDQRGILAPHVTLVPGPRDAPPYLLKTLAPLAHPAEVMVLIDADMIVTRSLAGLIEKAAAGRVVAFRNDTDRFVPEWGEILDLGTARRRPYVTSGLVLLGGRVGRGVLELLDDRQRRVDFELTFYGRDAPEYPFRYPEQDVLNAILATSVDPDAVETLGDRLAAVPPYRGLRLVELRALRCAYPDGVEPYVLHQFIRKPWLEPMYHGIYSRLLVRALLGDGLTVSVPESAIPLRMRDGALARTERVLVNIKDLASWHLGERLPGWVRDRVGALRRGPLGGP